LSSPLDKRANIDETLRPKISAICAVVNTFISGVWLIVNSLKFKAGCIPILNVLVFDTPGNLEVQIPSSGFYLIAVAE
jgi:hypothetical protein